jgi:hypothetical protein
MAGLDLTEVHEEWQVGDSEVRSRFPQQIEYHNKCIHTGSITPFWNEQKANIIVTLVKIMTTFCY